MDTFYGIVRGHAQETIILSRKKNTTFNYRGVRIIQKLKK